MEDRSGKGGKGMGKEEKLTREARQVLNRASEAAAELGHTYVGTEHLLLALGEAGDTAAQYLRSCGIGPGRLRQLVEEAVDLGKPARRPAQGLTPRTKNCLQLAAQEAARLAMGRDLPAMPPRSICSWASCGTRTAPPCASSAARAWSRTGCTSVCWKARAIPAGAGIPRPAPWTGTPGI